MRIAIIADIHGNHLSLKAALRDIEKEATDTIFVAGDYLGYYYHADEVINALSELGPEAIRGNHDEVFLDIYKGNKGLGERYRKKYGSSMDIAIDRLKDEQISYLSSLPEKKVLTFKDKKILLCHGSPWDINEYIYPNSSSEIFKRFASEEYDIIIMGHTHHPMLKQIGNILLINPGSLGQARTAPCGAHWALLDIDRMQLEQKVTSYDMDSVIREAQKIDSDIPYLSEVLQRYCL